MIKRGITLFCNLSLNSFKKEYKAPWMKNINMINYGNYYFSAELRKLTEIMGVKVY
jgi:hypothetical protein